MWRSRQASNIIVKRKSSCNAILQHYSSPPLKSSEKLKSFKEKLENQLKTNMRNIEAASLVPLQCSEKLKNFKQDLKTQQVKVSRNLKGVLQPKSLVKFIHSQKNHKSEEKFHQSRMLKYYIQCCDSSHQLNLAINIMAKIRPDSVEPYEELFTCLSQRGELEIIKEFWSSLVSENIQPSLKCFAAVFQCLGHENLQDSEGSFYVAQELQEELHKNFEIENYTDLFDALKPKSQTEFDRLLRGIKIVENKFEPRPNKKPNMIENPLLDELKSVKNHQTPLSKKWSSEEIQSRFLKQMENEKAGYVTIENITYDESKHDKEKLELVDQCMETLKQKWSEAIKEQLRLKIESLKGKEEILAKKKGAGLQLSVFLESIRAGNF